jgi:predicted DCC family thiol-disulfide oxidoreductase YuxK
MECSVFTKSLTTPGSDQFSGGAQYFRDDRKLTVWFDGACPLCAREIALLRRLDRGSAIRFVDVSDATESGEGGRCPVDRGALLARFHAQEAGKPIVSGAAAFAAMWRAIPLLSPLGHVARLPPVLWALERVYRGFLRLRPRLQRLLA